jgi:UDP-N-acetylglucosamine--N-acetylmuramyl-(pentapeptide) pyrophosphoryl-undecaprenol N-acetylglucosamine transferase
MLTCAELCAWGLPSLLVPLPTAAADHQTANARALERSGASRVLPQAELTSASLGAEITALISNPASRTRMAEAAAARGRPMASADIVSHFLTLLG